VAAAAAAAMAAAVSAKDANVPAATGSPCDLNFEKIIHYTYRQKHDELHEVV
jgi:hypothetical protein